ncbi:hypothetical protein [Polyangium mundeleinium]|uniref:Uncharacterized protein n=1 Tax=Polyangium mundeleinium TaxID=2995306 RepID=A0ABT5ED77_9BACT|nr:hypothetical protein [Polyangium mundeleinium]MDC0739768.1 hypothetical protein [Polyangium mundeleinium]
MRDDAPNPYEPPKEAPPPRFENSWSQSADLSGADWALIVLCSCPAAIVGLVRVTKGEASGAKMLGFSILSMFVWGMLRACVTAAQRTPHMY